MSTATLESRPLDLQEMVGYQEGSVISRELVRKDTGTITLFAFDEGQGLSEHTAPFDAVVQIIDGEGRITINGQPITAAKGEMVIMPAHKPHSLQAEKRFKMLLTMIRS